MMADEDSVVDINRATVKDLETLFGVGRAKAESIYSTRMVKGTFSSLEELLSVPGIGRNVLEQNKGVLVCDEAPHCIAVDEDRVTDETARQELRTGHNLAGTGELSAGSSRLMADCSASVSVDAESDSAASATNTAAIAVSSLGKGSQSRRSSRRSSHHDSSASCSGNSSSRTARTTPIAAKYQHATSNKSSGINKCTIPKNMCKLDHDYSGLMESNSRNPPVADDEDSSMEWVLEERNDQSLRYEVPRLDKYSSSSSSTNKAIILVNSNSSDDNNSNKNDLIPDEIDETELNKLRVRESSSNGEDDAELSYNEDDFSGLEILEGALQEESRTAAIVPGSETPFEEPLEPSCGLLLGNLEIARARAQYLAIAARPLQDRKPLFGRENDSSLPQPNEAEIEDQLKLLRPSSSSKYTRRRKGSSVGGSNDDCTMQCSSSGLNDSRRSDESVGNCSKDAANSSIEEGTEAWALEESEDDEDPDKNAFDVDCEDMMQVEQSFNSKDKKQVKRKYDVGCEQRPLLPVKKSCKADESCVGVVGGLLCSSVSRRGLPVPPNMPSWLGQFNSWSQQEKLTALDSLIDVCDLNQVRHVHQIILPTFQRDFISLLPKELALYVLSFLTPRDLVKAAQTCKYWNMLTADNLLWREKCREAGISNFLDHMDKRRKKGTSVGSASPYKTIFMRRHHIECNWRSNPLKEPKVLKGHDDHVITCLQFSGNTIVSGSDDNTLKVWNATTSKCMRTLTGHTGGVWSSQMSGNIIVSGSTDRMLRVWDAETGNCIQTLYGHTSTVRCLHLHNDIVVSGSRDATLRVWDVTTGACNHVLVGHVAAVRCVQYNGSLVVSGAYDFNVKVWNPETEECLHTLQGHTNRVYSLQFDGCHVVSGSLDTTIRVWDVESGTCKHTLMGHQSLTSGMELHNNILISGNADSTVKVWDIISGQCLQTLSGSNKHRSAVTCLQFINNFVVTSSDDGTVKLWDVSTGEFVRNLVTLYTGNSGGVVWRIRASDTKLVCAVGSRNGTEETKLLVLDFDVEES